MLLKSYPQFCYLLCLLPMMGNAEVPVVVEYPLSTTWVEEDFFTQQEKYCEVDSLEIEIDEETTQTQAVRP